MKKSYVFLYPIMSMGGVQVLIQTLGAHMARRGDVVIVYCAYAEKDFLRELRADDISVYETEDENWADEKRFKSFLSELPKYTRVISFTWQEYSRVYTLADGLNIKVLLYSVHPYTMPSVIFNCNRLRWMQSFFRCIFYRLVCRMIETHSVVCMDEMCKKSVSDWYGIPWEENKIKIIRIPIETDVFCEDSVREKPHAESSGLRILSIGRADFPHKGYLIGLVELMKSGKLPENTTLEIVSYGRDYERLKKLVVTCPDHIRSRIRLLGRQLHSKLADAFYRCDVYVGHGTTLLDAVVHGTIAITTEGFSEKVLADTFFHEDYQHLGLDEGTGSEEKFLRLIDRCSLMSHVEYAKTALRALDVVRRHYGTDRCVAEIDNIFEVMNMEQGNTTVKYIYWMRKFKNFILRRKK